MEDRGTKKWTSIMMPEHTEMLADYWESLNDVEMPILSEDQLEDIQLTIVQSMETHQDVVITYHEQKRIRTVECTIRNVINSHIEIFTDEGVDFILFEQIMEINYV
jgi:hypothetical protein